MDSQDDPGFPPDDPEDDDRPDFISAEDAAAAAKASLGEDAQDLFPEPEPEPDFVEQFGAFDPRVADAFYGLAYLGELRDSFEVAGHQFSIRTLKARDKLDIHLLCKPWEGSIAFPRAWRSACVAAAILLIDGYPVLHGKRDESPLEQRWRRIVTEWHEPVIDYVFDRLDELEAKAKAVLAELGIDRNRRLVTQEPEQPEEEGTVGGLPL